MNKVTIKRVIYRESRTGLIDEERSECLALFEIEVNGETGLLRRGTESRKRDVVSEDGASNLPLTYIEASEVSPWDGGEPEHTNQKDTIEYDGEDTTVVRLAYGDLNPIDGFDW